MRFARQILPGIIRIPFRTAFLVIVFLIASAVSFIGNFLDSVLNQYEALISKESGYAIGLSCSEDSGDIPEELIAEISSCRYILGGASETRILVTPEDFTNYVPQAESDFDMPSKEEVRLCGVTDISFERYFMLGNIELSEGEYPTEGTDGVLVEASFAAYNDLTLGDELSVWNEDETQVVTFTVSGIYILNEAIEEVVDMDGSYTYGASPYSWIFCGWDTIQKVYSDYVYQNIYFFWCENAADVEKAYQYIENLQYDRDKYHIQNELEAYFIGNSAVMDTLRSLSNVLIRIVSITAYLICAFMVMLWMKAHYSQAAIYIALGQSRIRVLLDCVAEGAIVTGASLVLADLTVFVFLRSRSSVILERLLTFSAAGEEVEGLGMQALGTVMDIQDMLAGNGTLMVVFLLSALLSGGVVFRKKIYKLFDM